jgi:hypothetical protein
MIAILIVAMSLWQAYHYARQTIDPDWALFNMPGFTGAHYGKDFADCKTPFIHYWYWAIAKIVGRDVFRVKFTHHLLLGLCGLAVWAVSGNVWAGLVYSVLVNSGWLLAFHGNVGQLPILFVSLALFVPDPWIASVLFALAVLHEPKLLPSAIAWTIIGGFWQGAVIAAVLAVAFLVFAWRNTQAAWWLLESSVIIPYLMGKRRKGFDIPYVPWYTANGLIGIFPWLVFAAQAKPDVLYWLPAGLYAVLIATGKSLRPNHFLPLAAWVVGSGISPALVLVLVAIDWVSGGMYAGNMWERFYFGLKGTNEEARSAGEYLKDKPGVVWVNGIHTGVYIYAKKPNPFGMTEQVEIRDVIPGRRESMIEHFQIRPPDYIVETMNPVVKIETPKYRLVERFGNTRIGVKA